jgi:hypothetical protein
MLTPDKAHQMITAKLAALDAKYPQGIEGPWPFDIDAIRVLIDACKPPEATTGLQPLKHTLGRIREIAYGGGLTNARKISVDALRSHIDLAIKFTDEVKTATDSEIDQSRCPHGELWDECPVCCH